MKKILFLALITGVTLSSCSKKSDETKTPSNTVSINGIDYATVKIGTQTRTSVNYNGAGGANYNDGSTNNPAYGKLYTLAEAKAVTLPTGWRLPSQDDYNTLVATLGAVKGSDGTYNIGASTADALMAKTSWTIGGGTNTSGFNALAVGYNHHTAFNGAGTDAVFITTSILTGYTVPASFNIYQDGSATTAILTDIVVTSTDRASIRFVKNN